MLLPDHPLIIFTFEFLPPGILCGRPPQQRVGVKFVTLHGPDFQKKFSALGRGGGIERDIDSRALARMLAKIAHSFAVATYGLDTFTPFLPEIILDKSDNHQFYIGGSSVEFLPKHNAITSISAGVLHDGLIIVHIRLFVSLGGPAYRVVVGRLLNSTSIASALAT
jgi:hypothetical protein